MKHENKSLDGFSVVGSGMSEKQKHDFLFGLEKEEEIIKQACVNCGDNKFCASTSHTGGGYCIECHEIVIDQCEVAIKEASKRGRCDLCTKNKIVEATTLMGRYCKACHRLVIRESKDAIKRIQKKIDSLQQKKGKPNGTIQMSS